MGKRCYFPRHAGCGTVPSWGAPRDAVVAHPIIGPRRVFERMSLIGRVIPVISLLNKREGYGYLGWLQKPKLFRYPFSPVTRLYRIIPSYSLVTGGRRSRVPELHLKLQNMVLN